MDPATTLFLAKAALELGKTFGPPIIKAIWRKINGDNSQDALLAQLGKEKLKKLNELQQIRNDFTEYKNLQEVLDPNYKGPKQWPAIRKQQEKRLKNLQKIIDKYQNKFPDLKKEVSEGDFNSIQDILKDEIKTTEQQHAEAEKAIREGKTPGSSNNPNDQRFQAYSPEQANVLNTLSQLGLKGLQNNNFDFGPIEAQARADFAQKTVPSIAERFAGLNAGRNGSFPQLLSQAGADLERSLAAMKQNYNLNREGNFANIAQIGLKPQYGYAGPLITNGQQQPGAGDKFADWVFSEGGQSALGNLFNGLKGIFGGEKKEKDTQFEDEVRNYIKETRAKGGQISDYPNGIPGETPTPDNAPVVHNPYPTPEIETPGFQRFSSLRNRLNF